MENRIRELRNAAGLSQEKLAELLGTSGAHVSRLEKSQRGLTHEWMVRIALVLGVHPAELLPSPKEGEFVEDPNEIALLRFWRGLGREERVMITRMMRPAGRQIDDVA